MDKKKRIEELKKELAKIDADIKEDEQIKILEAQLAKKKPSKVQKFINSLNKALSKVP